MTLKLRSTLGAGLKLAFPAWEARIVQMPLLMLNAKVPETVQTAGVSDAKLTGSPDDAVAESAVGGPCNGTSASAPKVIVWTVCACAARIPMP